MAEGLALLLRIGSGGRQGHQSAQGDVGDLGNLLRQLRQFCKGDARLALFAAAVDLNAEVEWFPLCWALLTQTASDLQSIHTMYPVEVLRNGAGPVGLDGTDKVPDDPLQWQCLDLLQSILQVVLAKVALTRVIGCLYHLGRFGLADRQQLNRGRISFVEGCSRFNALQDLL